VKDPSFGGVPIIVNKSIPHDEIWLFDKNGPKPIVYVPSESVLDTLYRAIDADADFLKRCGVIVHIGDLPR